MCSCCKSRCVFISICVVQLVTISVRQAFDFLGFQWTPIVANFCQVAVLILALFGAYRYKRRIIAVYATWTLIWIGWNIFMICLYLNIGELDLDKHQYTLHLAITNTDSWFRNNTSFSCDTMSDSYVERTDCIDFRYVEVFQAAFQIILACCGFIISCYVIGVLEDESSNFHFIEPIDSKREATSESEEMPLNRRPLIS